MDSAGLCPLGTAFRVECGGSSPKGLVSGLLETLAFYPEGWRKVSHEMRTRILPPPFGCQKLLRSLALFPLQHY